jgi:hypothetical protein
MPPDLSILHEASEKPAAPGATSRQAESPFHRAVHPINAAADWLADRIEDVAAWVANLVRYLPARIARIAVTLFTGLKGAATLPVTAVRAGRHSRANVVPLFAGALRRGAFRAVQLLLEALDLVGTPELFAFIWRVLTRTSPLTGAEIAAATAVLGPRAVRYQDIRVAQGGILRWIFTINKQRAFATFHTINLPEEGHHQRSNVGIVVHEIVHVYQYERAGSRYFAEALLGQHEEGYEYGQAEGLALALRQGKRLRDFNREQQAQIAQDYLARLGREDVSAYEPFVEQLREGWI